MKKYFIMAVAVLASLTACQQNEPEATYNDGTIKFATAKTRADVTNDATLGTFDVFGYLTGSADLDIFPAGTTASKANSIWIPSVTKYWADGKEYNFFAVYAPTNDNDKIKTKSVNIGDNEMVIEFTNVNGNVDLVTAASTKVATLFNKSTNTTLLTFKHALARVAFQFNWDCNVNDVTIEFSNVKLGGTEQDGTLTVAENGTQTWTAETAATISYAAAGTLTSSAKVLPEINSTTGVGYQYIIPEEGVKPTISFDAVVKQGEQVIKTFDINDQLLSDASNNENVTWEPGKSYVFTMNINPNFSAIEFTVEVEEWSDVDAGTINFGN